MPTLTKVGDQIGLRALRHLRTFLGTWQCKGGANTICGSNIHMEHVGKDEKGDLSENHAEHKGNKVMSS